MNNPGAQLVMPGLQVLPTWPTAFSCQVLGSSCLATMLPNSQVPPAALQAFLCLQTELCHLSMEKESMAGAA